MRKTTPSRIYHIDALRGVAILMMLQGHFIFTMMENEVRVGPIYEFWKLCRGLTAPVFFTTSGVILVCLLLRKPQLAYRKLRIKKAFWRGLELIMWGYLLRFNLWPFLAYGRVYNEFWRIDVLHCIGVGLLVIACVHFALSKLADCYFRLALLILAVVVFVFHPVYSVFDYSEWPSVIRNYFTQDYGSVFKLLPHLGFVLFGGFLGSLYNALYEKRKYYFIGGLVLLGLLLTFNSSWVLQLLYLSTDVELFKQLANNNFVFWMLGQILLIYSLFMMAEPLLPGLNILNKLGQHTLTIYIIHFFVLYGSILGLGVDDLFIQPKTLNPYEAILGAIIFIIGVSWFTLKYHKWKDCGFALK